MADDNNEDWIKKEYTKEEALEMWNNGTNEELFGIDWQGTESLITAIRDFDTFDRFATQNDW